VVVVVGGSVTDGSVTDGSVAALSKGCRLVRLDLLGFPVVVSVRQKVVQNSWGFVPAETRRWGSE
jgi:hypothetical protein